MRRLMPVRLLLVSSCCSVAAAQLLLKCCRIVVERPLGRRRKRRPMRLALLRRGVCQHVAGVNDADPENAAKSLRCINFLFHVTTKPARGCAAKCVNTPRRTMRRRREQVREVRGRRVERRFGSAARRMRQWRYDGARLLRGNAFDGRRRCVSDITNSTDGTNSTNRRGTCAKCDGHRRKATASSI